MLTLAEVTSGSRYKLTWSVGSGSTAPVHCVRARRCGPPAVVAGAVVEGIELCVVRRMGGVAALRLLPRAWLNYDMANAPCGAML